MKILYVEDSAVLNTYVTKALRANGHTVDSADNGEKGLWLASSGEYDLLLLDVMLPKIDGFSILKNLRANQNTTPALMLTAKDSVADKLEGFQHGADDYLVKPFDLRELLARIEALTRRNNREYTQHIQAGPISFDTAAKKFSIAGELLNLGRREHILLELFIRKQGVLLSRTEIEDAIYGNEVDLMSNSVNSSISILRKTLAKHGCESLIRTKRGLGYTLDPSH